MRNSAWARVASSGTAARHRSRAIPWKNPFYQSVAAVIRSTSVMTTCYWSVNDETAGPGSNGVANPSTHARWPSL